MRRSRGRRGIKHVGTLAFAMVALVLTGPVWAGSGFPFRLKHKISLVTKGEVSGLAFHPDGSRVYVAVGHAIEAVDAGSGSVFASSLAKGTVVGVAVSAGGKKVYAVTRDPAQWLVLDAGTLRVLQRAALHFGAPDQMYYEALAKSVFVGSASSHDVARVAVANGNVLGTAHLGGPVGQIVSDPRGRLYVAIKHRPGVDVINALSMRLLGTFATPGCSASGALAIDPVGRRLFIGCESGETDILDTDMGFVFKRIALSKLGATRSVFAFHPGACPGWKGGAFAIAGLQVGAVRMASNVRYGDGGDVQLPGVARALALSPDGHELWAAVGVRADVTSRPHSADGTGHAKLVVLGDACGGKP